jgi:hypothetical protein
MTKLFLLAGLVLVVISLTCLAQQSGGGYTLYPTVVSAGGSPSSQGVYSLNGTIGQSGAGVFARTPPYTATGGFWAASLTSTPTAAGGSIGGRVTVQGFPLGGVVVILSGTRSAVTITNSDGYYSFENVETGGLYSLTAQRVNFAFVPATISFSQLGNHTEAIFNAYALAPTANPVDTPMFFVRQHYLDFLGREPDSAGLSFWTNQITNCGNDRSCIERKRIETSAAFFFSIEFQETAALSHEVVVGDAGWQQKLDNNKQAFVNNFVRGSRFLAKYTLTMTSAAFVDALYENAGLTPSVEERLAVLREFGEALTSADNAARARVLRRVTENRVFANQEFNKAFVLLQYFAYLRRNPNDAPEAGLNFDGYNFWLKKLSQFNGNFVEAEMVKAFLVSSEYRDKFTQPLPSH